MIPYVVFLMVVPVLIILSIDIIFSLREGTCLLR